MSKRLSVIWTEAFLAQARAVYLEEITKKGVEGAGRRAAASLGVTPGALEQAIKFRYRTPDWDILSAAAQEQYQQGQENPTAPENESRLLRENRKLREERRRLDEERTKLLQRVGLYERLETNPLAVPEWVLTSPTSRKQHFAIPHMLFTDVHWDEIVVLEQVDGINKYNRAIAELRVKQAFVGAIEIPDTYLGGVTYPGFKLDLGGDIFSGLIHEELIETNEGTIFESIITVLEPLIGGINLLAQRYKKVDIDAVVGNHGRRTRKPRAKHRVQDNFDWLVYKLLEREFRGRKDITIRVSQAPDAHFQVYNTRYLLTHGDQFKGGSGISGAVAPLLLGTHRKSRRQVVAGRPYDIMVMGHWHESMWMQGKGLIVGGSVVGYGEFSYLINAAPEPPQCALWLDTPERGVTITAPIFVQNRALEGW